MDGEFQRGNLSLDGLSRIKEFTSLYLCLFTQSIFSSKGYSRRHKAGGECGRARKARRIISHADAEYIV
ncbi:MULTISPECIES: hypothetical protein [Photorhabdus]|uniref:hypothetical protein n=1 Tax=Photorhabdus TaxID=29487 RepID=UPI0030D7F460